MKSIATNGRRNFNNGEEINRAPIPDIVKRKIDSMDNDETWFGPKGEVQPDVWGMASSIDIYGCDPDIIRDADLIRRFTAELCEMIEMKRFGETQVVHFGEDERVAGYSMVQLIETSLISAHFANQTNAVYLDVFSCKPYDPETVREFAREFFGGRHTIMNVNYRR
jgi:S-adenosylmethionine/arginine decarboxylase-like enzyme